MLKFKCEMNIFSPKYCNMWISRISIFQINQKLLKIFYESQMKQNWQTNNKHIYSNNHRQNKRQKDTEWFLRPVSKSHWKISDESPETFSNITLGFWQNFPTDMMWYICSWTHLGYSRCQDRLFDQDFSTLRMWLDQFCRISALVSQLLTKENILL